MLFDHFLWLFQPLIAGLDRLMQAPFCDGGPKHILKKFPSASIGQKLILQEIDLKGFDPGVSASALWTHWGIF